jgi:hypothetical protein
MLPIKCLVYLMDEALSQTLRELLLCVYPPRFDPVGVCGSLVLGLTISGTLQLCLLKATFILMKPEIFF